MQEEAADKSRQVEAWVADHNAVFSNQILHFEVVILCLDVHEEQKQERDHQNLEDKCEYALEHNAIDLLCVRSSQESFEADAVDVVFELDKDLFVVDLLLSQNFVFFFIFAVYLQQIQLLRFANDVLC